MRDHPDDAAFLDRLTWEPAGKPCDYGQHAATPTIQYGEHWICRADLAWRLHLERCEAQDAGREYAPTLAPAQ